MVRFAVAEYTQLGKNVVHRCSNSIGWLVGLAIGYLLLRSAIAHLNNPYRFLATILSYQLVSRVAAEVLAAVLPFVDLVIAICLISTTYRRSGFLAGSVLFLIYSAAQSSVYFRGMKVDCGCFGLSSSGSVNVDSIGLASCACIACFLGWWRLSA